ncbi:DNA-binding LytR/AlgR family response regulator [Granulicella aggregans]|uniref:DNA-binding LytR/AlgR family response regulator n=1 Tax=Granulicella aggregans TaxID=474949 RepID=A0A7W8E603_9BACT|nr:LytTR family DNA-binding domain-containing protein [Granulicella aggregans]MBB5060151.1 DNA-binding LytR/AlgR family response regulator [Granulicella aggregans]
MIRVFVVEDEPPALRKAKRLLGAEGDLVLCGVAGSCEEAIIGIRNTLPDLLLLDIHLPDGSGFEVLQGISDLQKFQTIFLTALVDQALEAFEAAAIDYLVKPVAKERFSQAIQRARERLRSSPAAIVPTFTKRFLVERLRVAYMLPVNCIEWIDADRNYARLFSTEGEFALRVTMDRLHSQLDPAVFARVSRSSIVRLDSIVKLLLQEDGSYIACLNSGAEVPCSKTFWDPTRSCHT